MMPEPDMMAWVAELTGATRARRGERLQILWSGYGEIFRAHLEGAPVPSVVVKSVEPPHDARHPRGWHGDRSHERKLRSYDVEREWYRRYAERCGPECRVPAHRGSETADDRWLFVLEDLDASGFAGRRDRLSEREVDHCLRWLAAFHATFLGEAPDGLWETGTYWHLATRPDELAAIEDRALREAAPVLDRMLREGRFQTLVHGDAKVANFCFARDAVAAVDFQYVGGGAGVKDVAYFLSSCASSEAHAARPERHLDAYFGHLRRSLASRADAIDVDALEAEWRALYPIAWADFVRFLAGWAPSHWKLDRHALSMTRDVLRSL